jgi:superfamily II DNA or RNA helicase
MELRPYQEEAVEAVRGAWEEGVRDPAVEIFCGLGKSLIMKTLLQELAGLRLIVMPSLSLVNQFCHDYLERNTYLPFCSLSECDEVMRATTQEEQVAAFLEGEPEGILVVTYKSLAKLLGFLEGREIEGALFDESHHIDERQYNFIKELEVKVAYFSATPPKNLGQTVFEFSYADALNYVDPDGESRPWSRDFRVLTAMYTDLPGDSMVETLARAIKDSGNARVLTFHAQVNGESENSVRNFHTRCKALQALFPDRKVTTRWMDATTSMQDRARFLRELDETPDDEVYVIHSCETISEGVDTKRCNHVFFCDAAMSYRIAIQKIGRCVRLREQRHPATVTIPACIPRDEYAALGTLEERNAYIREQYSALGKFSQLFDFIACLRENDQDLLDLVLQAHKGPGRKEHYERELGEEKKEKPRFTLEQAVQRITGQPFSGDLAADADTAGRTIELHSLENGVETHGTGAALETLVEMEPGQYVHTRRRVPPPHGNRLQFTESPFLLSLHPPDGDEIGDGVGGSLRTAVMDFEVRPERTDQIIQMLHDFYAAHGEPPKKLGARDHEAYLATWIGTLRQYEKKGLKIELCARVVREFHWWKWNGRDFLAIFAKGLRDVTNFVSEKGRYPSFRSGDDDEERMAQWCNQRRQKKGINLSYDAQVEQIPGWSWNPLADQFAEQLRKLKNFIAEHDGRYPLRLSKDLNESRMADWCGERRCAQGKNPEYDRQLEQIPGWSWDLFIAKFNHMWEIVDAYVKENGRFPDVGTKEAAWCSKRRMARGENEDFDTKLMQIPGWSWDPIADQFEQTIQELAEFVTKNERLPSQIGKTDIEKKLGKFCCGRRRVQGKNPTYDKTLEQIPGWYWTKKKKSKNRPMAKTYRDQFDKMLASVNAFVVETGRIPSFCGNTSHEKKLAKWCCKRRQQHGENDIIDESLDRIPGWYWTDEKKRTTRELTVASIKELLRNKGLSITGNKTVLLERLNFSEEGMLPAENDVVAAHTEEEADDASASGKAKFYSIYFSLLINYNFR